jgi:hypothetical protein
VETTIDQIADEIRRYCVAHPNACDTVDGIMWWIQMQRHEDTKKNVAEAVSRLVQRGFLQSFQLQDGTELFSLNDTDQSDDQPVG